MLVRFVAVSLAHSISRIARLIIHTRLNPFIEFNLRLAKHPPLFILFQRISKGDRDAGLVVCHFIIRPEECSAADHIP